MSIARMPEPALCLPTAERPNISIMIHMAVMAKKMNPAGVFTAFTMLPTVFLTICDGYFTLMRYAGMPPNIPPVHWGVFACGFAHLAYVAPHAVILLDVVLREHLALELRCEAVGADCVENSQRGGVWRQSPEYRFELFHSE